MKQDRGTLYRPVGLTEMRLVYESLMRAFPPRLREQPIFYPVLNFEYARQISERWNTRSPDFAGYVTRFQVERRYRERFETHIVGARIHEELWVPAEELPEFNSHILGQIEVVAAYFGQPFRGFIPDRFGLRGRDAVEQFALLSGTFDYSAMDFTVEISANNVAVFLNYPFWQQHDFSAEGIDHARRDYTLAMIQRAWEMRGSPVPLGLTPS